MKQILIFAIFLVALNYVFLFVVGHELDLYHHACRVRSSEVTTR